MIEFAINTETEQSVYTILPKHKVIKQIQYTRTVDYNKSYISKYYKNNAPLQAMAKLRFDYMTEVLGSDIESILDYGCGCGDFVKYCCDQGKSAEGYDITKASLGIPMCEDPMAKSYDVITFYDSLEHIEDCANVLSRLKTKNLIISVPWCHYATMGLRYFENWKHRRPNEHLWHFDVASLCSFMSDFQYSIINCSNCEDVIRKSADNFPNILTCSFKHNSDV